jgi:transcriptional regulator with XRE-family HTH domain
MEKANFNKEFGEFIRLKRTNNNWNQPQLGDKMGIDFQYISRVERGLVSPTLFWISRLANAFDLPLEKFIKEFTQFLEKNK